MNFFTVIEKFNNSKFKSVTEKVFSSYAFPFVTAAVSVLSATFGLEVFAIWYICICGTLISLCCKDLSPVICLFVFMSLIVSVKHSPFNGDAGYMLSTGFLSQAIIAVFFFVVSAIYRIVDGIIKHRFKINSIFIGLCVYICALILNGIFSNKLYYMDTVYGLAVGAILLFAFVYISGNVELNKNTYLRIAYIFVALTITLGVQLLTVYISSDVIVNGSIDRNKIGFGWGTYNQFGVLITTCIPVWFYLANKYKYGYFFILGVILNLFIAFFCMSRQAILASVFLVCVCSVWYLITAKKYNRLFGGIILLVIVLTGLICVLIKKDWLSYVFAGLINNFLSGSGRTTVWQNSIKKFLDNPIFGNGFYDLSEESKLSPGFLGQGQAFTEVVPFMAHNTILQLLYCSGIVGLLAYLYHRYQTVLSLVKNPTANRVFIALTICGILLTSLLDNHIFYPFPLFIYGVLLGLFSASEKDENNQMQQENTKTEEVVCNDQEVDC